MSNLEGQFLRELSVEEPVELVVESGAGDVLVQAGEPGKVVVQGSFHIRAFGARGAHLLAELLCEDPPVEVQGHKVRVGDMRKYTGLGRALVGLTIDYRIAVPEGTEATVKSGSGDVRVQGVAGPLVLRTGSGDVEVEGIRQGVKIQVGSGDVRAKGVGEKLRVTTGSGDVLAEEIGGEVEIRTGSGTAKACRVAGALTVHSGSGDLTLAEVGGGVEAAAGSGDISLDSGIAEGKTWRLRTGSGDVVLRLPQGSHFRLVAESDRGRVESDFASDPESPALIEVKSGSGDIELRAR